MLLLLALCAGGRADNLSQLYRELDQAIAESPSVVAAKERKLQRLRDAYHRARRPEQQYAAAFALYAENKAYQNDSAIHYLRRCMAIASKGGDIARASLCNELIAECCARVGYYAEAITLLNDIPPLSVRTPKERYHYHKACYFAYEEMANHSNLADTKRLYSEKAHSHRDALFAYGTPNDDDYRMTEEKMAIGAGDFARALRLNNAWLKAIPASSHQVAIVYFYRYQIYHQTHREAEAIPCLIKSAIIDVRNGVMDQASLLFLSRYLQKKGEKERSFRYVHFAWQCNKHFNTRRRTWTFSPLLSMIDNNYQQQIRRSNTYLSMALCAMGVLFLLLLLLFFYLYRQKKRLHQLNASLQTANQSLNDANRIKEEYIGRFLNSCNTYVNKLDKFRQEVNRQLKNGKQKELYEQTRTTELKTRELNELYAQFDATFLSLFPRFIDEFNAMLVPEARVFRKDKDRLTTELRIFALIRLGIDDSRKIAEFLHCSIHTIYNYRARFRAATLIDKELFAQRLREIGRM